MLKNIQKLKYFQDFLRKKGFSSIININEFQIDFSFETSDKQGYKINIEINTETQVEKIIDISILALKDIFNLEVSYNDFLPPYGFNSSIMADF